MNPNKDQRMDCTHTDMNALLQDAELNCGQGCLMLRRPPFWGILQPRLASRRLFRELCYLTWLDQTLVCLSLCSNWFVTCGHGNQAWMWLKHPSLGGSLPQSGLKYIPKSFVRMRNIIQPQVRSKQIMLLILGRLDLSTLDLEPGHIFWMSFLVLC